MIDWAFEKGGGFRVVLDLTRRNMLPGKYRPLIFINLAIYSEPIENEMDLFYF